MTLREYLLQQGWRVKDKSISDYSGFRLLPDTKTLEGPTEELDTDISDNKMKRSLLGDAIFAQSLFDSLGFHPSIKEVFSELYKTWTLIFTDKRIIFTATSRTYKEIDILFETGDQTDWCYVILCSGILSTEGFIWQLVRKESFHQWKIWQDDKQIYISAPSDIYTSTYIYMTSIKEKDNRVFDLHQHFLTTTGNDDIDITINKLRLWERNGAIHLDRPSERGSEEVPLWMKAIKESGYLQQTPHNRDQWEHLKNMDPRYNGELIFVDANGNIFLYLGSEWIETTAAWIIHHGPEQAKSELALYSELRNLNQGS